MLLSLYKNKIIILILLIQTVYLNTCYDPNCMACEYQIINNVKQNSCIRCEPGFTLLTTCIKPLCSDPQCKTCDNSNLYCIQCSQFYSMGITKCIPITLSGLMLFVFGYCLFVYCFKKYRRRNNLISNSQQRIAQIPEQVLGQQIQHQLQNSQNTSNIQILNGQLLNFNQTKDNCVICLQNNCELITKCQHYFHIKCFSNWMRRGKVCPLCNNSDIYQVKIILCLKCKKWQIPLKVRTKKSFAKLLRLRKANCKYCC